MKALYWHLIGRLLLNLSKKKSTGLISLKHTRIGKEWRASARLITRHVTSEELHNLSIRQELTQRTLGQQSSED